MFWASVFEFSNGPQKKRQTLGGTGGRIAEDSRQLPRSRIWFASMRYGRLHLSRPLGSRSPNRGVRILSCVLLGVVCSCASRSDDSGVVRNADGTTTILIAIDKHVGMPCHWTMDTTAALTIRDEQFFRAGQALLTSDTTMMVLNAGTSQLRVYGLPDGRFLRATSKGGGPGELERPNALARFGRDSVIVYDNATLRLSVFTADGIFVRTFSLANGPPSAGLVRALWDTAIVIHSDQRFSIGAKPGLTRDSIDVIRYTRTGALVDTVRTVPGSEALVASSATSMMVTSPPFARSTEVTIVDSFLVIGDNAFPEVSLVDRSGAVVRTFRFSGLQRALTGDDFRREVDAALAGYKDAQQRRALLQLYDLAKGRKTAPAFDRLLGVGHELWIQDYRVSDDTSPVVWTVVNEEGTDICRVQLPPRFTLTDVTPTTLIGMARDSEGVQRIEVHSKRMQ